MVPHLLGRLDQPVDELDRADEVGQLEGLDDRLALPLPALELGEAGVDLAVGEQLHAAAYQRLSPGATPAGSTARACHSRGMRIASLVPSATEALFALGLGDQVVAVTHECDHPAEALGLPRLTRSVIPAGLEPGEVDARVRELTGRGEALYELDEPALARLAPDLIVTQALCAVCAVSYDDVRAVAERLDSRPEVISLDPRTLGEVLDDLVRLGEATGARDSGEGARGRASGAAGSRPGRGRGSAAPARGRPRVARPALRRRSLGAGDDRAGRRARALPASPAATPAR